MGGMGEWNGNGGRRGERGQVSGRCLEMAI